MHDNHVPAKIEENVRVVVRTRPLNPTERFERSRKVVTMPKDDPRCIQVLVSDTKAAQYRCNRCFGHEISQEELFNQV